MKFGKSLIRVVETSDPEWGPYWINYKFLKKKINEIAEANGTNKTLIEQNLIVNQTHIIIKSSSEIEFFRLLKKELKKTSDFFINTETICRIRKERIWEAFNMLNDVCIIQDKNTWTRLLKACVKFYKDVLLLENFAIMNYCGFSKILKKHDKLTGFVTRDAFMRNVMNQENFTHYPYVMQLIKDSEKLFEDIQKLESVMPLQAEERLFIEAMRVLNQQATKMQNEEKESCNDINQSNNSSLINNITSTGTSNKYDEDEKRNEITSSLLDAATTALVDAAIKLNNRNLETSPNLQTITSWMQQTISNNNTNNNKNTTDDNDINTTDINTKMNINTNNNIITVTSNNNNITSINNDNIISAKQHSDISSDILSPLNKKRNFITAEIA